MSEKHDKSVNKSASGNSSLSHTKVLKSEYLPWELLQFVNIYLDNLRDRHPELEIVAKDRSEFWDEIDKYSRLKDSTLSLWPNENKDIEFDERDEEDLSVGLVYHVDNSDWRLKSPDEIENTHVEDCIVKYEIENELEINFKKMDERFDPEELSIYRVSVTPLTKGSIIKQIFSIKIEGEIEDEVKVTRFEDENEIVFIKTDISIFDNSQVDRNQLFLVSTPYTIFLWIGHKVDPEILKGTISIFRCFSLQIRKIPLIFNPSYMDEEQNLSIPNLQIIYKNSESARFQNIFKEWREIKFGYLMLRTTQHYKFTGRMTTNKPRFMTLTGKLSKLDNSFSDNIDMEEEKEFESNFKDDKLTEGDIQIFRNSTTKKHKAHQISALVNVDVTPSQKKQITKNMEVELTYHQGQMVQSMQITYNPQEIF